MTYYTTQIYTNHLELPPSKTMIMVVARSTPQNAMASSLIAMVTNTSNGLKERPLRQLSAELRCWKDHASGPAIGCGAG